MIIQRHKTSKTGVEFSYEDGLKLMRIYDQLDHKSLLIAVCKEMLLNELELIYFKIYIKQIGWYPNFLK